MKKILFYRTSEQPYGAFSNFSAHPILIGGKTWPTTEHYFQAQKFPGTAQEENIRQTASPMIAARMGRSRDYPLRSDWESVKDTIMREAIIAKFTQHPALRELLISTDDALLIEHTTNDSYWADGGDGSGRNKLGEILMEVREMLKRDTAQSQPKS